MLQQNPLHSNTQSEGNISQSHDKTAIIRLMFMGEIRPVAQW
jgi:hypothetical protein